MAKARIFDLPETKGAFQLKGIVSEMQKDNAYEEKQTKTSKAMRKAKFGVVYEDGKTLRVNVQGVERDNVYFFKRAENKGEKGDTVTVSWTDRFSYNREGYRLIGMNVGVSKKVDSEGKEVNDKKDLTEFDACKEIHDNLKDGASVFVRGNLDYSSFTDDKGNKINFIKLSPNQVSLCADVNFADENFKQQNDFNQVIIFMGIDKEKDDNGKETGRFVVEAKIVTYSTIEDVEFIIEDAKLASMFRKNLKPYNAIKVSGRIVTSILTETVDDEDDWGEHDAMERPSAPAKREFIITGAKGSTVDKELYTKENIEDAMAKIAQANKVNDDFGTDSNDDWGDVGSNADDDDEAWD